MDIKIMVANKIATAPDDVKIVCGNSDYTMTFIFDEEWEAEKIKTVRFVWHTNGRTYHKEFPLEGDTLAVPVFLNVYAVFVGVYAGDLKTTTAAKIPCEPCILCCDGHDEEIDQGIFARLQSQVRTLLAESVDEAEVAEIVAASLAGLDYPNPKVAAVHLPASGWTGINGLFSQTVEIDGVTANSQVDLHPTPEQLSELLGAEISMTTANNNGTIIVYSIGGVPEQDYVMQIRITEVES